MKDIACIKKPESVNFYFLFKHTAQILMCILGSSIVGTFAIFYLVRPYSGLSDESYFFIVLVIATLIAFKLFNRYRWLSSRKRIEVKDGKVRYYLAEILMTTLDTNDIDEITTGKEHVLIFPLNSITIHGNDAEIKIIGFKRGDDLTSTYENLKKIILQKNQE